MRSTTIRGMFAGIASLLVFAGLVNEVDAQGRYVGRYSRVDVDRIIRRLEDSGDEFRRDFESQLDRSNLSNSQRNTYRRQVDAFENATDRLRENFDRDNEWWRSRSQVQGVVSVARPLNTTMNSIAFRRNIERQWNRLRDDINTLADTFDLAGIAGGGWNGGGWNGDGIGGGVGRPVPPPSWAQGTWYWQEGYGRTMQIDSNGRITLYNQGRTSYGSYNRGNTIFIDGITSSINRSGRNIRTVNSVTGEVSTYSRNNSGGGEGGNMTRPPSWARGTWYWVQGPNRRMVIEDDGRITLFNQGRTSFGTYNNGTIFIDGITSTITRNGRGIRTYNQATGEVSDYRR